jgi:hypothetical protein
MKRRIIIRTPEIRARAAEAVAALAVDDEQHWEVCIQPYEESRTLEQNARMWAMLSDIARQVQWPVNGQLGYLTKEDWKDILTASLSREQRVAPGTDGGFVLLGQRTSRMKKRPMSDLIKLAFAFGDQHGVQWTDPKIAHEYDELIGRPT